VSTALLFRYESPRGCSYRAASGFAYFTRSAWNRESLRTGSYRGSSRTRCALVNEGPASSGSSSATTSSASPNWAKISARGGRPSYGHGGGRPVHHRLPSSDSVRGPYACPGTWSRQSSEAPAAGSLFGSDNGGAGCCSRSEAADAPLMYNRQAKFPSSSKVTLPGGPQGRRLRLALPEASCRHRSARPHAEVLRPSSVLHAVSSPCHTRWICALFTHPSLSASSVPD
jgi:hypothetical protein